MKLIIALPLLAALFFAVMAGMAFLLELFWTHVAVAGLGAPPLTYWQCFGLWCAIAFVVQILRSVFTPVVHVRR